MEAHCEGGQSPPWAVMLREKKNQRGVQTLDLPVELQSAILL
jgi:hypothetical protein